MTENVEFGLDITQFVPKYFEMDPELHDLLANGRRLRNGMQVLIENQDQRVTLSNLIRYLGKNEGDIVNARKWNRWTTVTNLEIVDPSGIPHVTFIGVFEDGTKKQFSKGVEAAWYVKLDSIPEEDPLAAEQAELKEAMATLVETSKTAWSSILDMLKEGIKDEADLLDSAAERLYEKTKDLKFSEKPFYRQATVHDIIRNFIDANMDFFTSKEVHSLNEIHPSYNYYCDQKGFQYKLNRNNFMQHMKTYFKTWASLEEKDEHGLFETDTQLIGFFNPHLDPAAVEKREIEEDEKIQEEFAAKGRAYLAANAKDVEAGYSEQTNNKENK